MKCLANFGSTRNQNFSLPTLQKVKSNDMLVKIKYQPSPTNSKRNSPSRHPLIGLHPGNLVRQLNKNTLINEDKQYSQWRELLMHQMKF
uniref:Uncharacterized protein n=1 Tax=Spironucleus salmonicida TaxID=348837 RepID=V6LIP4_9EUKA|eukprot:EST44183.1 Hypothetical protein SS50377_15988 [Spironucleus salmonicida]